MKSDKAVCLALLFLNVLLYAQSRKVIKAGSPSRCLKAPPAESRCRAAKPAYFFNAVSGVCESFLYGGCSGDHWGDGPLPEQNVFRNLEECMNHCGPGVCPEAMCLLNCQHGFLVDKNGCQICECKAAPDLVACPQMACVEQCANGYDTDAKGCPTCKCKHQPSVAVCQTIACPICPDGYVLDSRGCQTCECLSSPDRPQVCPAIECDESCPRGYLIDSNGCQTCDCITPNPSCVLGPRCMMYCEHDYMLDQQGCPRCACASKPSKRHKCSEAKCLMHCPAGFRKDAKGCPLCDCASDPCEVVDCRPNEVCVQDYTIPKRIKVRCVSLPGSETGMSGTKEEGFGVMMAVVAAVITFTLISLFAAFCIMICRRRQYRRRAEAIYKPVDSSVHM